MKTAPRKKISKSEHSSIHNWLRRTYGKADHCEFCEGEGLKYEYALIQGKEYARDRSHYYQLCVRCHRNYDFTDELAIEYEKKLPSQKGRTRGQHLTAKKIMSIANGREVEFFDSLSSAKDIHGYKVANISMCLTGLNKTAYGKKWEYC